jgi:hypothetical protein
MPDWCYLYRCYDAEGRLLYIGISLNPLQRTDSHSHTSRWFHLVVDIKVKRYWTRGVAIAAERDAIIAERPLYNKSMNGQRCTFNMFIRQRHITNDTYGDFVADAIEDIDRLPEVTSWKQLRNYLIFRGATNAGQC